MMTFDLQRWSEAHRDSFAEMQSDPDVMADLGGPYDRAASNEKFDRYRDAWNTYGISRWAVVNLAGSFLGYAGVMARSDPSHPLGAHHEIGWRFRRDAWGRGLATETARQALCHAWSVLDAREIVSYTAINNVRSQNVMQRLNLTRDAARDFTALYGAREWTGLVWIAKRPS